jgi:CBS domain-containing protein
VLLEHQLRRSQRVGDAEPQEAVLRVGDVCTLSPYVAQVTEQLDNVLMELSRRHATCVLVLRNDKLAGILTATDACRLFAEHLRAPFASASPLDDEPA